MKEGHHKKPRISAMAEQLGLSDEQKAQIEALEAQHKQDREALKEKYQISERESFREEKKALRKSFRAQLHEILTDDQIGQLKSMRKNKKQHARNSDK